MSASFRVLKQQLSQRINECVRKYHECPDHHKQQEIEERYLRCVEPLLHSIVSWQSRTFAFLGVCSDDLLQWARLASIEALHRYDASRSTQFTGYLISFVKRYVYNKVLDDLPIPRSISKQIRRLTRDGFDLSLLPDHLRTAYMIRSPICVDNHTMESIVRKRSNHAQDTLQEAMATISATIGQTLWQQIYDVLVDDRPEEPIEHLVVSLTQYESNCPKEALHYIVNLKRYLVQLMSARYLSQ